jgi:hypothetical protein
MLADLPLKFRPTEEEITAACDRHGPDDQRTLITLALVENVKGMSVSEKLFPATPVEILLLAILCSPNITIAQAELVRKFWDQAGRPWARERLSDGAVPMSEGI